MMRYILLIPILFLNTINTFCQTRDLQFYLSEGQKNSPLLKDFANQASSAMYDSLIFRAAQKPLVGINSQILYAPVYHNAGYDDAATNGGNYAAIISVSQKILNKKELNNKSLQALLQKRIINNSSKVSSAELDKLITDQYLVSLSVFNDFEFNTGFTELFEKEKLILSQFMTSGICKQTDYLSLLVEGQTQEMVVNQLRSQYRKELSVLNQLCGIADTSFIEVSAPLLNKAGVPDVGKTASLAQYRLDSLRIRNEYDAIDISYKPKVNWFADAGILSSTPWNFYTHLGYSAGVNLSIPVYDGKQRGLEKKKLEFEENSRTSYQDNYLKKYEVQVSQLDEELRNLDKMREMALKQVKTADQLLKALRQQLEAGNIQMTDYVNAVRNFRTISHNLNIIDIQKLQVINEINFLVNQ